MSGSEGESFTPGDPASQTWAEPFVLTTEKTRLRPSTASDAARLFPHVHRQPEVTDWICWDGPEHLVDLVDRYVSWRLHTPAEPVYVFIIERVADGQVIGEGTLRFDGHPGVGDLGYWLGKEFHGRGHGSDAVELLVEAGFGRCGARALTAQVKAGNVRSIAALRKAEFQVEPHGEPHGEHPPEPHTDSGGVEALTPAQPPSERPIAWVASMTRRSWDRRKGEVSGT